MKKKPQLGEYKGILFLILLLALWEAIGRSGVVRPAAFLPPVSEILTTLFYLFASLQLPHHLLLTLYRALLGLTIATALAIPLGIMMGYFRQVRDIFALVVEMLRPMPSSAVIPVAILFLGIWDRMEIAVITFGCLWPILVNTIEGVRGLDPTLVGTGRTFNLKRTKFFWEIVLKGASPYIMTGIRISLAISLILAITVEMIAQASGGLGYFIIISEQGFKFDDMYAGILTIAFTGWLLNKLFTGVIDHRLMGWYRGYTAKI